MGWNKRDWERRIRFLARDPSCFVWTTHVRRQVRQRHISPSMALEAETAPGMIVVTAMVIGR